MGLIVCRAIWGGWAVYLSVRCKNSWNSWRSATRPETVTKPDARSLLPQQFDPGQLFDLVLCDGQVLRTHVRAPYREMREARRLAVTQLAIGLEHLRIGGTMVVLLHKVEATDTV